MGLVRAVAKGLFVLSALLVVSCGDEQDVTVGGEVLPGSSLKFEEIEVEDAIRLTEVSTKRIQTNNLPYYRLGKNGNTTYELVLKPLVPLSSGLPEKVVNDDGEEIVFYEFQSAKMVLSYRFDTVEELDVNENIRTYKLIMGAEQSDNANDNVKLNLYALDQEISNIDPSVSVENIYYADGWRSNKTKIDLSKKETPAIVESFVVNPPRVTSFNVDGSANDNLGLNRSKNIEDFDDVDGLGDVSIQIDSDAFINNFKTHFSENPLNSKELQNKVITDFAQEYKSFYLEVDPASNNIYEVLPQSDIRVFSRIETVFKLVDENGVQLKDSEGDDMAPLNVQYFLDVSSFTDNGSHIINLIKEEGVLPNEVGRINLKNGIGSVARLELFPKDEDKSLLEGLFGGEALIDANDEDIRFVKGDIISKALLRFTVEDIDDDAFELLPDALVLNRYSKSDDSAPLFPADFNRNSSSSDLLLENHLISKKRDGSNVIYDIIVTEHLQQILNREEIVGAENQNFDFTLSVFNRDGGSRLNSAIKEIEGNDLSGDGGFLVMEGALYSDEELSISYSNDEGKKSLKPKLIIKFTPAN